MTPTSCGRHNRERNIVGNYSTLQQFAKNVRSRPAGVFQRPFHRLSARSRQVIRSVFHKCVCADSLGNAPVLHNFYDWISYGDSGTHCAIFFINFFNRIPEVIADAANAKKGERRAESKICGKGTGRLSRRKNGPLFVVVIHAGAHNLWHVEQFTCAHTERRHRTCRDAGILPRLFAASRGTPVHAKPRRARSGAEASTRSLLEISIVARRSGAAEAAVALSARFGRRGLGWNVGLRGAVGDEGSGDGERFVRSGQV
jgi:hypothetical protein